MVSYDVQMPPIFASWCSRNGEVCIDRLERYKKLIEPELAKCLSDLDVDDSISARVRSALTELLPGGAGIVEDVAEKLGLSRRTLQRKLAEEKATFQKQLNSTRAILFGGFALAFLSIMIHPSVALAVLAASNTLMIIRILREKRKRIHS